MPTASSAKQKIPVGDSLAIAIGAGSVATYAAALVGWARRGGGLASHVEEYLVLGLGAALVGLGAFGGLEAILRDPGRRTKSRTLAPTAAVDVAAWAAAGVGVAVFVLAEAWLGRFLFSGTRNRVLGAFAVASLSFVLAGIAAVAGGLTLRAGRVLLGRVPTLPIPAIRALAAFAAGVPILIALFVTFNGLAGGVAGRGVEAITGVAAGASAAFVLARVRRGALVGALLGLLTVLLAIWGLSCSPVVRDSAGASFGHRRDPASGATFEIRGITLAPIEDTRMGRVVGYGTPGSDRALDEIAALGANWVCVTPFGSSQNLRDADVVPDAEWPIARVVDGVGRTIDAAHARGLRVMLIPHVWMESYEWRGEIAPAAGWDRWFSSYGRFVGRWADVAERHNAEAMSVGVEYGSASRTVPDRWRALVTRIRSRFSGWLTYSANWDEVADVGFWDALDVIGVNAFRPLADRRGAGFSDFVAGARAFADDLEALARSWNRPVLLTEFGVRAMPDAAVEPWVWPEHLPGAQCDPWTQAEAFEAMLSTFVPRPWFAGLFVWKYFSNLDDVLAEDPCAGFSPRGKPAEQVLHSWFESTWR